MRDGAAEGITKKRRGGKDSQNGKRKGREKVSSGYSRNAAAALEPPGGLKLLDPEYE